MLAWAWRECPNGCDNGGECLRVDLEYGIDNNEASVYMRFTCEHCGLDLKLEASKKPKVVYS